MAIMLICNRKSAVLTAEKWNRLEYQTVLTTASNSICFDDIATILL